MIRLLLILSIFLGASALAEVAPSCVRFVDSARSLSLADDGVSLLAKLQQSKTIDDYLLIRDASGYVSFGQLLNTAYGIKPNTYISFSANELRYVPRAQNAMSLTIVTSSSHPLTEPRAKAVASAAKRKGIVINVVWLAPEAAVDPLLSLITSATGGQFIHLGMRHASCQI